MGMAMLDKGELQSSIETIHLNISLLSLGLALTLEDKNLPDARRELFNELKRLIGNSSEECQKIKGLLE
jgi:hypothetical protein